MFRLTIRHRCCRGIALLHQPAYPLRLLDFSGYGAADGVLGVLVGVGCDRTPPGVCANVLKLCCYPLILLVVELKAWQYYTCPSYEENCRRRNNLGARRSFKREGPSHAAKNSSRLHGVNKYQVEVPDYWYPATACHACRSEKGPMLAVCPADIAVYPRTHNQYIIFLSGIPWQRPRLPVACHGLPRQGQRVAVGHGVVTARAMVVPMAHVVGLAMAAHDSAMARTCYGNLLTATPMEISTASATAKSTASPTASTANSTVIFHVKPHGSIPYLRETLLQAPRQAMAMPSAGAAAGPSGPLIPPEPDPAHKVLK